MKKEIKPRHYGYYKITCVYQMWHLDDHKHWIQYFYDLENVVTQEIYTHVNTGVRKLNRNKIHYGYIRESGIWERFTSVKEPNSIDEIK